MSYSYDKTNDGPTERRGIRRNGNGGRQHFAPTDTDPSWNLRNDDAYNAPVRYGLPASMLTAPVHVRRRLGFKY